MWVPGIVWWDFKRIDHPKMKILSFTQPWVVLNLYELLCSPQHKYIFCRMFITRRFLVPIDSNCVFYLFFFSFYESHAVAVWLLVLFPIYYFAFNSRMNLIQVKKNNRIFIFGWTILRKQPSIAAVAIFFNNVNHQTSERKSLHVLDWITFVK